MSSFDELSFPFAEFSGKARLFPLPNLVMFPHVMQPLHVFERRYRTLLADALAGDQLITMATLAPGWEKNYEGRPPLHPMACLGRITTHHRLSDGTYNVLLLGLRRVHIVRELAPTRPFREAEVSLCEDRYSPWPLARQRALVQRFRDALLRFLPTHPAAQEQLDQLLCKDVPLGMLTDVISYMLDGDVSGKQRLLQEVDVFRRVELLLPQLSHSVAEMAAAQGAPACFAPQFSTN